MRDAKRQQPDPGNGPPDRMFVPASVSPQVLQWIHASRFACHLGVRRTPELLKRHFWWPVVDGTVIACTLCSRCKTSHKAPAGLLQPLPIPERPWSHITLDFITRLPPSNGNMVVLTMVDQFLKSANF